MKIMFLYLVPVILMAVSCGNEQVKTTEAEPAQVLVTEIRTIPAIMPVHSNGILVSSEEIKLSFKTGGIVASVPVNEGNRVKKGSVLALLDLSEISATVYQAELGYAKALRDYERTSNLHRDSVATLEQKQNASTALYIARSKLSIARFNLTHSRIIAPENGVILKIFVKENELVGSGNPVILFGSSAKFWKVKAGFSDKDIVKISIGDSAVVTFDAYPDSEFYAYVDQIGEIANPMTGTYEVELSLIETDRRLVSGFVAGIDLFTTSRDSVTVVPVESVVEADGNRGYVYIIKSPGVASKVNVELFLVTGSDIAVKGIPEGISEVIYGGAAYLRDGDKVKVIR